MANLYSPQTMARWRKDVENRLGFALRIPEYDHIGRSAEEYLSPLWFYDCRFYSGEDKLLCHLRHSDGFTPFTKEPRGIPGIPETFGTDEDWIARYAGVAPPFRGFPWSFDLCFFDSQERKTLEIAARRTFMNDSVPMIHMAWYLTWHTYDKAGKAESTYKNYYFDWEIHLK